MGFTLTGTDRNSASRPRRLQGAEIAGNEATAWDGGGAGTATSRGIRLATKMSSFSGQGDGLFRFGFFVRESCADSLLPLGSATSLPIASR
jgi:hypothetical protein